MNEGKNLIIMKKKKLRKYQIMLVIVLFIGMTRILIIRDKELISPLIKSDLLRPESASDHDPIIIDGNMALSQFIANESLIGEGTLESPYIIENFTINATSSNGFKRC